MSDVDWRRAPARQLDNDLRVRLVKFLLGHRTPTAEAVKQATDTLDGMSVSELIQVETQMNMAAENLPAATAPLRQGGEDYDPFARGD